MNNNPCVSLLVAMHNEANYIERCVASLIDQTYPSEKLEVIILDGQSTDGSWHIVENLIKSKSNFKLLENPKKIQAVAWNLGLQICKGEIASIVSGHAFFEPDYVSKAVETLHRTGADMVGGTVHSISSGKVGEAIALAMSHPFGVGGARFRYTAKEEQTDSVFMGFCRREIYEKIGKYDEELVRNQDDEFSYRLSKAGGRIICNPEIKSYYHTRSSYSSLWRQYFQYGYWKVRVLQKHPRQMRLRQFVPLAFVLSLLFALLLSILLPRGWLTLLGLLGLYLLATLFVSLRIASEKGWKYFFLLPLAFMTIHISYGFGFLVGLFKFWNRWGDKLGRIPPLNGKVPPLDGNVPSHNPHSKLN